MKPIIINGRFLVHKTTGVERYAKEIINELDNLAELDQIILAIPPEIDKANISKFKNIKNVQIGKLNNRLWEKISFPLYVFMKRGISLNLCNVAPLLSPGIVCIHDVKIKAKPQFFNKKFLLWYKLLFFNATKRAKAIITVSEFSKREIQKYYKVESSKIHVVNSTWQHFEKIEFDNKVLGKYNLEANKYYFSMSSIEPNKNIKWIAEAAKNNTDEMFVIAGIINEDVFSTGLGFECPSNMQLLGYISDAEAKTLMRDCKAFLFPTFYEGFGLPPMEAYSAGAKCAVVSNTEVMHEIYGDAVIYINPNNYSVDLSKVACINHDKILDILGKYSWKKSASDLYEILRPYLGN